MQTKKLTKDDALKLCQRSEDHFFDKKAFGVSGAKIQKIAVAFANADSGEFIIGIADDSDEPIPENRWQGASSIEDFNSCFQVLTEIKPTIEYTCTFLYCDDFKGYVLLINVEKSSSVHCTSDNTVYQRISAQSLPIKDPEKIMALSFAKGASSYEDQLVSGIPTELVVESKELQSFLKDYSPQSDPLEYIINQNLVDQKTWEPRAAGILLFCDSPSALMPKKCAVKIARYETKEESPERDHLKEQNTVEGPLYPLIYETVRIVTEIMSSVNIWTLEGLKKVSYPPESLWEIIVNAIIHRDYSISDDIHIHIYNDRIEVISPGRLPGYVTVASILDVRYARNPKIVRSLNRYKQPPNKDMGEGLNTAFQKMKDWKLKAPEIHEDGNYVKVILAHTPLASPEEAILEFLNNNSTIKNSQARDITGIRSENLVKIVFYKLRDQGLIERVPGLEGPASAWQMKK